MHQKNRVSDYLEITSSYERKPGEPVNLVEQYKPTFQNAISAVEKQIARHPGISVVLGLSAGVLLGWIIKRR